MSEHAASGRPSELVREVWCPSRTRCWQRATISGSEGARLTLRLCETGELVPRVDAASLCDVDASHDEDLGDAAEMNSLHEGPLLHLLRRRLEERRAIYTWAGAVLISVNPYADVPLYGSESLLRAEAEAPGRAEPHIYAVARRALLALLGQPAADARAMDRGRRPAILLLALPPAREPRRAQPPARGARHVDLRAAPARGAFR